MSIRSVHCSSIWRPVPGNRKAIEVDLGADPRPLRAGSRIAWRWGRQEGWALIELREDGELYQDGRMVSLYLEPEQVERFLQGPELKDRLEATMALVVLHPNVKTALMENKRLFPRSWRRAPGRLALTILFWAVGFKDSEESRKWWVEEVSWEWEAPSLITRRRGRWIESGRTVDGNYHLDAAAAHVV